MMIHFAQRLSANAEPKSRFAELFAAVGVQQPKEGEKVPLHQLDEAIKDLDIEERLIIKSSLFRAGLI